MGTYQLEAGPGALGTLFVTRRVQLLQYLLYSTWSYILWVVGIAPGRLSRSLDVYCGLTEVTSDLRMRVIAVVIVTSGRFGAAIKRIVRLHRAKPCHLSHGGRWCRDERVIAVVDELIEARQQVLRLYVVKVVRVDTTKANRARALKVPL